MDIHILNAPLLPISSTEIRKDIKEGRSIRYLVPENVRIEIERNSYYQ
jgi:nicotinate-nucleotide adenylyltransferase